MAKVKKLGEIKGDEALDLTADLLVPLGEISADKELVNMIRERKAIDAVALGLRKHKESVYAILDCLLLEGSAKELSIVEIPAILLEILNDSELVNLFTSQEQISEKTSSGPAMENIEASGK